MDFSRRTLKTERNNFFHVTLCNLNYYIMNSKPTIAVSRVDWHGNVHIGLKIEYNRPLIEAFKLLFLKFVGVNKSACGTCPIVPILSLNFFSILKVAIGLTTKPIMSKWTWRNPKLHAPLKPSRNWMNIDSNSSSSTENI